jgi:aminopeptidase N
MHCSTAVKTTDVIVEKGVSQELATYRSKVVSELAYALHFTIPEAKEQPISATESISFKLNENKSPLQLDFKENTAHLKSLVVNAKPVAIDHRNEHIIIPAASLKTGKNQVDIEFIAGDLSLNRSDDFLYTLLVPDRARTVFPVFDQPSLKATFQLTLTLPKVWQALANDRCKTQWSLPPTRHFASLPQTPSALIYSPSRPANLSVFRAQKRAASCTSCTAKLTPANCG